VARRRTGVGTADWLGSQLKPRELRISVKISYRRELLTISSSKLSESKLWEPGAMSKWTCRYIHAYIQKYITT